MIRRAWFPLALLLASAAPAHGAEVTIVADAADVHYAGNQPIPDKWDLYFTTLMESTWISGVVAREYINGINPTTPTCNSVNSRGCEPVDALRYTRQMLVQWFNLEAGLYHDLSLTLEIPVVYNDTTTFNYATGVNASNSSVDTGNPNSTLFPHDFTAYHSGLGNVGLGLRWGIINDERDESKPSWVLFFKWFNPASTHTDRFAATSTYAPGNVGDGIHRLMVGMAFSKRVANLGMIGVDEALPRRGYLDPYAELSYTYPIPAQGFAIPSLSGHGPFASSTSQIGRLRGGVEFVAHEDLAAGSRFVIDLGMRSTYMSEARNYSVLSDALQRATWTEQQFNFTGYLGMYVQAAHVFKLKLNGSIGYDTEHWLTDEIYASPGANNTTVANPYYCGNNASDICSSNAAQQMLPSVDAVGFRFRERAHVMYSAYLALLLYF